MLQKFIGSYFDYEINIAFIGHMELGRNNVYLISNKNQVLKVYGDKSRWAAEISSLKFLQAKDLYVPKLVDYGIFEESLYWIIMSKLDGIALSKILDQITPIQYKKILYDMGCTLSNFHNECKTIQFGEWDENMNKAKNWLTYVEFETEKNRRRGNVLLTQNLDENNLFKAGYSKMISLEKSLACVNSFSLCHNDFSDRNILVKALGDDIEIIGLIDFELSYPRDAEADLTQMLLKNYFNKDKNSFILGYRKTSELSDNFDDKHRYYLISLCLEICSWAHEIAYDFYQQAVDVLKQLV